MPRPAGLFSSRMESYLVPSTDPNDTFQFERLLYRRGFTCVAGTDEVGRGPLAGPVVAAAVVLPADCDHTVFRDSKKTSENLRYRLRQQLYDCGAFIGIGIVDHQTIDRINILQASLLAMTRSVAQLAEAGAPPDYLLIDGTFTLALDVPQQAIIKGDSRSASIAAASIVAKIARDEIMAELHERYPDYNFLVNKGYPTKEHREAVRSQGPSPVHRQSFKGVKEFVAARD